MMLRKEGDSRHGYYVLQKLSNPKLLAYQNYRQTTLSTASNKKGYRHQ